MVDKKISELTAAGALTGAEEVPVNQLGTTVKTTTADIAALASGGGGTRNYLINGAMAVAQRGTSFTGGTANADDAYTLDRWYILSDGNDIVDVTQETTTIPTNGKFAMALDVETVDKKFGIAQIIEGKNCTGIIGNTVTLSFKAKVSSTTNLDNVKAAIISWSGTEDTVTSDIVSAWGVEGTNPTLIANATYENTPVNLNLTTSYATYSVSAAIDTASTKNVIVFIWSDVTTTSLGEFLYITDVQLEAGGVFSSFVNENYQDSLASCHRYYFRAKATGSSYYFGQGFNNSTTGSRAALQFPCVMRAIPTAVETTGTATDYWVRHQNTTTVCSSAPTFSGITTDRVGAVSSLVASGLTVGDGVYLEAATSSAYIGFSAEL